MLLIQSILFLIIIILINCSKIDIESTTTITQSIAQKVAAEIQRIEDELKIDENQLKIDQEKFEEEKRITTLINNTDAIRLNVGGEIIMTTRQTLTKIPKSILSLIFNGRWEHKLQIDQIGNIFFDFNTIIFRHLLDQLQIFDTNTQIHFYPPSQSSFVEPFKKMLKKLGLYQLSSLEKTNIITFNIGGQFITNRYKTFNQISNSTFDKILLSSKITNFNNQSDVFLDYDPKIFQHLINQLRKESFKNISYSALSLKQEKISFEIMLNDLNIYEIIISSSPINNNTKWKQNGLTIAGSNGNGNQSNQLYYPRGMFVDDDHQCIYIADRYNHRIVEWKYDAKMGQVVAGGNDFGTRMDELNNPTDVIVDKKTDSLIICDHGNRRVVRWPRQNGRNGETIISDIHCRGLTMDNNEDLYVSDVKKNEVRRWKIGEKTNGTIVAGGYRKGNNLNQLNAPIYLFVDKDYSVYVSDRDNHRVMKWIKGAKEGIVVAGGQGKGNSSTQLFNPHGVIVDDLGNVYVADSSNHRIMCWSKGSKEGRIIVGGNGQGKQSNQFSYIEGLSFDREGNLYVVDWGNHRVQKFEIDLN